MDVRYLKPTQGQLFEIDPRRKRAWFKFSEIKIVNSKRLPQGIYFIEETNSREMSSSNTAASKVESDIEEYNGLKQRWLRQLIAVDLLGFAIISLGSIRLSLDFLLGSMFGLLYLRLLMDSVDNVGKSSVNIVRSAIASTRLLAPFAAVGTQLILTNPSNFASFESMSRFPGWNLVLTLIGFSSYRFPLLIPANFTGFASLQTLSNKSKGIQRSDKSWLDVEDSEKLAPCIVLAGPSGVGKTTFIRRLLHDYPDIFGFSISHTTRLPREHEKDGISYYFVSKERFLDDVSKGKFIEFAQVHGNYYGTSVDSVKQVIDSKKVCLLDLDIQGVRAVKKSSLRCMFIWIAAPSIEALEARLRNRKSETEESIQRRLNTAKEEILFALRSGVFDHTVINDDIDKAYEALKSLLGAYIRNK